MCCCSCISSFQVTIADGPSSVQQVLWSHLLAAHGSSVVTICTTTCRLAQWVFLPLGRHGSEIRTSSVDWTVEQVQAGTGVVVMQAAVWQHQQQRPAKQGLLPIDQSRLYDCLFFSHTILLVCLPLPRHPHR